MKTHKLFIASSTSGLPTAKFLYGQLQEISQNELELELDVDCWWAGSFQPGASTLENLIEKCKAVDFAIILLTPDDFRKQGEIMHLMPRDNCIYEAGLFTGSLGLNPRRCFVLTACELSMLPTDLRGLTVIEVPHESVERSDDLSADAKKKLKAAARIVAKQVKDIGCYTRDSKEFVEVQPASDLLNWERLETKKGHLHEDSHVSVTARQPLESKDPEFAARIHENMNGMVYYRYYFYADKRAPNIMAGLVYALTVCGVERADDSRTNKMTLEDTRKVRNNLQTMGEYMRIYLLEHEPPFHMCIHNAEYDDAKCYVRFPGKPKGRFIHWCEGMEAIQLADSLVRLRKGSQAKEKEEAYADEKKIVQRHMDEKDIVTWAVDKIGFAGEGELNTENVELLKAVKAFKEKEGPIFCATSEFDLYDEKNEKAVEYKALLRTAIRKRFSNVVFPDDLREEIVKLALGEK